VEETILNLNEVGKHLYYEITPSNATNTTVEWESSDEDIVKLRDTTTYGISEENAILPKLPGTATITVTIEGTAITDSIDVTVINPVQSVVITTPSQTLNKGDNLQLEAVVTPPDADGADDIIWTSLTEGIIEIDKNGYATAISAGTAKVYAEAGGIKSEPIEITVSPAETINLASFTRYNNSYEPDKYLANGGLYAGEASIYPQNAVLSPINTTGVYQETLFIKADDWRSNTENDPKAWVVKTPTDGCTSFEISIEARTANAAQPVNDFTLQYSTDGENWIDIEDCHLTANFTPYNCAFSTGGASDIYFRLLCTQQAQTFNQNSRIAVRTVSVTGLK
jgi:hypothetical protein